jgi:hypothetical protein
MPTGAPVKGDFACHWPVVMIATHAGQAERIVFGLVWAHSGCGPEGGSLFERRTANDPRLAPVWVAGASW